MLNQDLHKKKRDTKNHNISVSNVITGIVTIIISSILAYDGMEKSREDTADAIQAANKKLDSLEREIEGLKKTITTKKPPINEVKR